MTATQPLKPGVSFDSGQADISLWAPLAEAAALFLPDKNQTLALQPAAPGYWRLQTYQLQPGDLYWFVLNGEARRPDPASLSQPEGVHGPSQALDLKNFPWTDEGWRGIPLEEYILYELHTGTFTDEGTFAGIESRLAYLKELGINAIELMPCAQFPGGRNWGYDGVYPFAVQDSYGGARGLQQLVDACHRQGIAVVLDVVLNHLGPEGNYLGEFGPAFTDKYTTPWGRALNFDDAWCDGMRQLFIENVLMWFRDFHIDALRLDAVHAIKDFSPDHLLREMKRRVDELVQETGRPFYLIAECDLNDTKFIDPLHKRGYGMDAQWVDEFHHALRVTATGEQSGYYSDFTGIAHLAKSYQDAFVYTGEFSPHRKKRFGEPPVHNPGHQFVVFSQNHDQIGNRMLGDRISQLVSAEMLKLLPAAVFVSPFLPLLFMGEEWGETAPFLYFVSHTDPGLAEAVREGRKREFSYFSGQGDPPDPTDEATFRQSKLQWNLRGQEPHQTLLRYYQALIRLRRQHPVLRRPDRSCVQVGHNEAQQTLWLFRECGEERVLCLMNFSKTPQSVPVPALSEPWRLLFDSADPQWNGPAASPAVLENGREVTLQPESILIYDQRYE
ncbi:malto-oligosyltrehalose trehalohydrolase [Tellurirhabdus rosea]|uniref:malto-oligosyltrehalose trehalohydrolase n=1 Tax=Tellurirhabdus rosea TaxID=2674997 RepID=UPI00225A2D00|nr:malto-oligosyltrehalose trehalohydrolase [Tellurirhabdus rosea]